MTVMMLFVPQALACHADRHPVRGDSVEKIGIAGGVKS